MRNIQTRILALLLAVLLLLGLTGCGEAVIDLTENVFSEPGSSETAVPEETPDEPELPDAPEADPGTPNRMLVTVLPVKLMVVRDLKSLPWPSLSPLVQLP